MAIHTFGPDQHDKALAYLKGLGWTSEGGMLSEPKNDIRESLTSSERNALGVLLWEWDYDYLGRPR